MLPSNHFWPSQPPNPKNTHAQPVLPVHGVVFQELMGMAFSGMPLPPHLPWAPVVMPKGDLWPPLEDPPS